MFTKCQMSFTFFWNFVPFHPSFDRLALLSVFLHCDDVHGVELQQDRRTKSHQQLSRAPWS